MFQSRGLRATLLLTLVGFCALMSYGWSMDSTRTRTGSIILIAFALVLAIGIAMPVRGYWALRVSAGSIAAAYFGYLIFEVWAWWNGKAQSSSPGAASVANAVRGLFVFGVPFLLFAIGRRSQLDDADERAGQRTTKE